MICIDTNVAIGLLNERPASLVPRFRAEALQDDIALPAICLFELHYGIEKSSRRELNTRRLADFFDLPITVLPFEGSDAEEAGEIRAALERAGTPIGPYDILIAAQARRRGATLVTANTREFGRVAGLKLEDWSRP